MPEIALYGKPGCCLCDEARRVLDDLARTRAFDLEEVDVSIDPALNRRYGERIPVVEVDGVVACELGANEAAIERLLDRVPG